MCQSLYCSQEESSKVGIIWLKTVLTRITGFDPDDINGDGNPEGIALLVDDHHAISRGNLRIKPFLHLESHITPPKVFQPTVALNRTYDVFREEDHHECNGYPSLNTGLSPPFVLA